VYTCARARASVCGSFGAAVAVRLLVCGAAAAGGADREATVERSGRSVSVGWRVLSALRGTRCGCMTLRRRTDSEPIAQVVSQIGSRRGEGAVVVGWFCCSISSSVAANLLVARYWSMCSAD